MFAERPVMVPEMGGKWENPWLHLFLACKFDPVRKGNFDLG
jgi:hypothetical protein